MKKFFLLATALLALAGCKDDEVQSQEEPQVDEISVLPEAKEFDNNGGAVSVMVTSTGEWTLGTKDNASYDWVTTDKTKGVDGDMIKFTVSPNETEEARHAYYVFTSGTATAEFKITSFAGEIQAPSISIDETEIVKGYEAGTLRLKVKYSEGVDYRDIKAVIPEETTWLRYQATLGGNEEGVAEMAFEYDALEGLESRSVDFNVNYSAENPVNIPVKMTQKAKPAIIPEQNIYNIGFESGTLSIKVSANVEYNFEITDGDWLKDHVVDGDIHSWTYDATDSRREATITFTEAAPADGVDPVIASVNVIQSNALITTVANMNGYRAVFASPDNKDIFKLGKTITVEMLVKPESGSFNGVNAMFGIERRFLIRHSDSGNSGQWELVYALNEYDSWNDEYKEAKVKGGNLTAGMWTHIAVTVDEKNIKLYQGGTLVGEAETHYDIKDIDLSEQYKANRQTQEFAIGYAYDNNRFFKGLVSEVRVWNRVLTESEIKEKDHFYYVDSKSEGLVAYWKMDDGNGSVFKDYTSNGNDLEGQTYTVKWNKTDIVWETVSLP